jgi:hypothetical protein
VNVAVTRDRFVWCWQKIVQVLGDPVGLGGGKVRHIVLRAEDGDSDEIPVLILDRQVGNEAGRVAGIFDVALLQRPAHLAGWDIQGVAADEGEERLVVSLRLDQRRRLVRTDARGGKE